MDKVAVARMEAAIETRKTLWFVDYDVDGTTAVSLVSS
jgi:single-stranded DNA-specific DHH superfamily exonuclease